MSAGMACRDGKVKFGRSVLFAPRDVATDDEARKTNGEQRAICRLGNGDAPACLRKRRSGVGDKRDKGSGKVAEHAGNSNK